jgi:hypothetical protein
VLFRSGEDGPGEQRTVSLHRWVVDEEFGPCFFHDHLLANFRQRRGLFSALMVQPHGSQWHRHDDQSRTAWFEPQAVIVPPAEANLPPYREACLGVADYVPMVDRRGHAVNPPPVLSGMSDPGVMGVNYRAAPMRFRGADPSLWFSSAVRNTRNFAGDPGDPDTPIIQTYPGERLRIRLIQGSHEEQHSFTAHGLRWRRDWGHPEATLVNQQTLGISECFTLDINPADASPYEVGDHLWHFGTLDDIWLGNWGLVRVLPPLPGNFERFAPLPDLRRTPLEAFEAMREAGQALIRPAHPHRSFVVVAQRHEHRYVGDVLTDPWGLIYRAVPYENDKDIEEALTKAKNNEALKKRDAGWPDLENMRNKLRGIDTPLVLRAKAGEWIRVILVNDVLEPDRDDRNREREGRQRFGPEPSPARLPAEHRDVLGHPDRRSVSTRVSIHPSLLRYDVRNDDGSFVGRNPDTTVSARYQRDSGHDMHGGNGGAPVVNPADAADGAAEGPGIVISRTDHSSFRNWREYWWYADPELAPVLAKDGGVGQVCLLHDMADIRNHRHHGLIGALIVLPKDVEPFAPKSHGTKADGWTSFSADIKIKDAETHKLIAREGCWFMQDGLRFFVHGSHHAPMTDVEPGLDPVDCGQKAVNYRSVPVRHGVVARTSDPLMKTDTHAQVWLRVLGANDKPRQQGVVVHGTALRQANWMGVDSPLIGAMSGIAPCRVENFAFKLTDKGDHAVRSGSFLWAAQQGMWAHIRVE